MRTHTDTHILRGYFKGRRKKYFILNMFLALCLACCGILINYLDNPVRYIYVFLFSYLNFMDKESETQKKELAQGHTANK